MSRSISPPSVFSKVSIKCRAVIPCEVRERLDLKPGDTLRYRSTEAGILLDKAAVNETDGPFAAFSEWSAEADEQAYASL
jgi:AbrB family looped-hinge helix DNA binding protein